ncbi:MAG: hypothetical protein Q8J78_05340 [Moraxellaceae bacterium]|nr:hypothetical protein [Moraxellaceae bacterium]
MSYNDMQIKEIKKLSSSGLYSEALSLCANLLRDENNIAVLRERAHIYTIMLRHELAATDWEAIINSDAYNPSDLYLGSESAIACDQYVLAKKWLITLIESDSRTENWFSSAARFYLAYTNMMEKEFWEAETWLSEACKIDANISLPIPGVGLVTAESLGNEIKSRKNKQA